MATNSTSIIKYFNSNDLQFGMSIKRTGEVRSTAFKQETIKPQQNQVSGGDEFGFNVLQDTKDYENSKLFSFGIDLSSTLNGLMGQLNGAAGTSLSKDKTIKTNEILIEAYRKITKSESTIDLTTSINGLQLHDDAKSILKESTQKFHSQYGDYFIAGIVKGGALSLSGRICADSAETKREIAESLTVNGDAKLVVGNAKGDIKNQIELKKNTIGSHTLNQCTSKSIGLTKSVQNRDFNRMMEELETLDDNISDGCVLYYILYKYDLCMDYNRIIQDKTKWQLWLEQFETFTLTIQRDNLDLYKNLMKRILTPPATGPIDTDQVVQQKQDEIDIQLKLNELIEKNTRDTVDTTRLNECVSLVKSRQVKFAIDTMSVYGTDDFLAKLIEKCSASTATPTNNGTDSTPSCYLNECLDFAKTLNSSVQSCIVYYALFDRLTKPQMNQNDFIKLLKLANEVKRQMESLLSLQKTTLVKGLYEQLKGNFPLLIRRLIWDGQTTGLFIRNSQSKAYLHSSTSNPSNGDLKRVDVTHSTTNKDYSCFWLFEFNGQDETFLIRNKQTNEFICLKHDEQQQSMSSITPNNSSSSLAGLNEGNKDGTFGLDNCDAASNKPKIEYKNVYTNLRANQTWLVELAKAQKPLVGGSMDDSIVFRLYTDCPISTQQQQRYYLYFENPHNHLLTHSNIHACSDSYLTQFTATPSLTTLLTFTVETTTATTATTMPITTTV